MSTDALYHVNDDGPATIVHFDYPRVADEARSQLYGLVEGQGKTHLVLDFSSVVVISSMALGILVTLQRKVVAAGGKLALFGLDPNLRYLFQITQLDRVLTLCETKDEAVAAISG